MNHPNDTCQAWLCRNSKRISRRSHRSVHDRLRMIDRKPAHGTPSHGRRDREAIAGAAHCLPQAVKTERFEGFAQTADVHVDSTLFDVNAAAPYVIEKLAARVHAFGVGHEKVQ